MRALHPALVPALLLIVACKEDDDPVIHHADPTDDSVDSGPGGKDSDPLDTDDSADEVLPYDPDGGGTDTFDATWSRCEAMSEDNNRWTFHAELRYTASAVSVELSRGDTGYEIWYLQTSDNLRLVWEVEVPGYSDRRCDETIDLGWTATGGDVWAATTESQYTPP